MNKNKDLTIQKKFSLAIQKHQENNFQVAVELYNEILKLDPNHLATLGNLGNILRELGENQKAINCYKKIIEINPNDITVYINLSATLQKLGQYTKAKNYNETAIKIDPNFAMAHYNLAIIFTKLKEPLKAINSYQKAIQINLNYADAHYNLGSVFQEQGEYQIAINCYEKTIKIDPAYAKAYNNQGNSYIELFETQKAKIFYEKAIDVIPNYTDAYWNLHSSASNVDEALSILKKLNVVDNKHIQAKIMIGALEGYKGNFDIFNDLLTSTDSNHPYARSVKWVFSLPKLPKVFFNRSSFFDNIILLTDSSKPFYEFGVWKGISFQYLINTFKKGFGFDTFTGLPESWHKEKEGTYTALGSIPKIEGGEFIVGKFEDTLPNFFLKERPMASLINFDADLYSSTLCALNYSDKVIDEKTILVFDEFIMNEYWEKDEYKALNEFCDNLGISYEVLAVSFFTKQVAVKLKKN